MEGYAQREGDQGVWVEVRDFEGKITYSEPELILKQKLNIKQKLQTVLKIVLKEFSYKEDLWCVFETPITDRERVTAAVRVQLPALEVQLGPVCW